MKNPEIVIGFVSVIAILLGFLIGKITSDKTYDIDIMTKRVKYIYEMAGSFIAYADQFMNGTTGEEKMDFVIDRIIELIDDNFLFEMDRETIKAIAQKAYVAYKAGKENTAVGTLIPIIESGIDNTETK